MKELSKKLSTNLFYCETCNRLFKPAFVENFINEYSAWDKVKAIKGSYLNDYFIPVKNENYYGVAFLETPQDWNTNYYIVHVYETENLFKKGYKQRYIERLEKNRKDKGTMKKLDKEMIEELRYYESINQDVSLSYVEKFIDKYSVSVWETVDGVLLDDYFIMLRDDQIYGVGFLETFKNTQLSYYNIKTYKTAVELENAYDERYMQYLECVVNKVDGERSAINYLIGLLDKGLKASSLENELYNAPYLNDENDNDSLYLRLVDMKEGNFKDLVIKALDKYIEFQRNKLAYR